MEGEGHFLLRVDLVDTRVGRLDKYIAKSCNVFINLKIKMQMHPIMLIKVCVVIFTPLTLTMF